MSFLDTAKIKVMLVMQAMYGCSSSKNMSLMVVLGVVIWSWRQCSVFVVDEGLRTFDGISLQSPFQG